MRLRTIVLTVGVALLAAGVVAAGGLYLSFPVERTAYTPPPVSAAERAETIAALRPPKRARPLVAVIGENAGSETTDYLIPYGVLKRSGAADVVSLGVREGPVKLIPVLTIVPEMTIASFDDAHPDGADYVIVPAMHRYDDPDVGRWLRAQSEKGATIVGICAGAIVVANAGLLRERRATTHWFWVDKMHYFHSSIRHVPGRRYVVDRGVVTTTGVSASLPVSLALVEAIAGRERADALAAELGAPGWEAAHASGAFHLTRRDLRLVAANTLAFWRHETVGISVSPGVDEAALGLVADAYANTFLARVRVLADTGTVVSASGIKVVADGRSGDVPVDVVADVSTTRPAAAFDEAFSAIERRYGRDTAALAKLSLEYPR